MSLTKQIYLIAGTHVESYSDFSDRILKSAKKVAENDVIIEVNVTYTRSAPPKFSIIPFKKKKVAAISIYKRDNSLEKHLELLDGFVGAYSVEEAIPVSYKQDVVDLQIIPGVCLFTLFRKRKDIPYDVFIDRWHNSHTPLSLKIHPLWNYNRNVATKKLVESSENWDGIVEEQFKTQSELLNPIQFFGHPFIMPYRMWLVYSDTKRFLEYRTIEPYFAVQQHIKGK